ncbi:MAG TPA: ABC transporter substrate-binding protein [Thermoleophilia bacterium]|nr:ABC transporter substrate-binding protein [Thermoleophilia bacterium]
MRSSAQSRILPRGLAVLVFTCSLALLMGALVLVGCGSSTTSTTAAGSGEIQPGGILSVATEPATNRDPAFASGRADILINQQVYDWLVEVDQANQLIPGLATNWESPDGKTWTFTLRPDVKFSNGSPFTADDVVYTFDRLRNPDVGSPLTSILANVTAVAAVDPTHVQFTLKDANPEFPSDTADYHAAILSKAVTDPATEWIGTGPFTIASYSAEDRAVLKKNPVYWNKDDQGRQLPYLDEIDLIFSPDLAGQVESLRGGQVQFVAGLTSELVDSIKSDSNLQVITGPSSAFHYVIHMRSDSGHPAADVRVRKALHLGTDHQGLIDQVRPGLAVIGNGTPVGPAYGDYYLDQAPAYDPEQAKQLLAEAGSADGLTITLYAQQALEVPAIATVWKEQMKAIGVTVNIQTVPADVYYGEGDSSWLNVDFGITEWGARATPNTYFNAAYVTDAAYNESHWSDQEFDTLIPQINSELDRAKRVELYKKAQEIMIERGPVIVPFFETAAAGASATLSGIALAPDWSRTLFRTAYYTR